MKRISFRIHIDVGAELEDDADTAEVIDHVVAELDYSLTDTTGRAKNIVTEIDGYQIYYVHPIVKEVADGND